MKNKLTFNPEISFEKQTPKMLIEPKKQDPLYEEAFLAREEKTENEFAQNTTTWD